MEQDGVRPEREHVRTQTETMSATIGGVDSFTVHPYDYTYECHPSELGERAARNQQLLLKEESHFDKIVDPCRWFILYRGINPIHRRGCLETLLEVQEQGGMVKALESGIRTGCRESYRTEERSRHR